MSSRGVTSTLLEDPPLQRGSFPNNDELDFPCANCYAYLNRNCERCSRCASPKYTPCLHCDLDLR